MNSCPLGVRPVKLIRPVPKVSQAAVPIKLNAKRLRHQLSGSRDAPIFITREAIVSVNVKFQIIASFTTTKNRAGLSHSN